jgi:hypothetical protein
MKKRMPSPALAISAVALFFALAGGAYASGIVPLARHAITAGTANNALKLGPPAPQARKVTPEPEVQQVRPARQAHKARRA